MNTAFLLLMLTLAHGTEPSSPEAGVARDAAWAETRDQLLPSLEARAKAARIAEQARQSFFAGTSSTAEAWGTLALRDLDRRDAITARMAALDRAMVTGKLPFKAKRPMDLAPIIASGDFLAPRVVRPDLSEDLEVADRPQR